jgi:hypothetical protein
MQASSKEAGNGAGGMRNRDLMFEAVQIQMTNYELKPIVQPTVSLQICFKSSFVIRKYALLPAGRHAVGHAHQDCFNLADFFIFDFENLGNDKRKRLAEGRADLFCFSVQCCLHFGDAAIMVEITEAEGKSRNGIGNEPAFSNICNDH